MQAQKLYGLEPKTVLGYFEALCAIPHGSGNTKQISDFLVAFAEAHQIRYIQDSWNNVLFFQEGTCGYEDHAPVILQGHMDMVCDKDADCPIDMDTQGLDIGHDSEWIFAKGTTLGGDNGIAVAFAMALLSDKSIPHPPLEVIITVDEETGMYGAAGVDLSILKGNTMLNLDSEEEGIFTVSCAGGARSSISMKLPRRAVYGPCIKLVVEGLQGGHSGVEIHKKRANANKVMGQLLGNIQEQMPLCITSLAGGAKDNAIPRSCQATIVAMGMHPEIINEIADRLQTQLRTEYDEPEAVVRGENVDALGGNALSTGDSAKVIALLNTVPNGVQSWSQDIPGLVQTSLNLGVLNLNEELNMVFAVRSSVNSEKTELMAKLKEIATFHGAAYDQRGEYPAWEYRKDSPLREAMVEVYTRMYGKQPEVVAIHAGLECGLLSEKIANLDCVSIGPNMQDIHTSRERLNIASTQRTWEFLLEILKKL